MDDVPPWAIAKLMEKMDTYFRLWKVFTDYVDESRHRNHCHITGDLLLGPDGHCAAHGRCNINASYKDTKLVVMAHFGDYDMKKLLQYTKLANTVLQRVSARFSKKSVDKPDKGVKRQMKSRMKNQMIQRIRRSTLHSQTSSRVIQRASNHSITGQ